MKRTAIVTAAALMLAGMTSLSLAGDKKQSSVQHETSAMSSEVTKSADHTGKETKAAVLPSSQSAKTISKSKAATSTSKHKKRSEPRVENKPAATLSDAAKSTVRAANEQTKEAVAESVKSVVPTPSVPTSPTVEAAKTAVTPVAPTALPTK